MKKDDKRPTCPYCGIPYSDWFTLGNGVRYCYPCWSNHARKHGGCEVWNQDFARFAESRK